jgi:uncharacterized protein (DUF2249 family)
VVIRADERVAQVLRRDERLIDAFAAASPAFERLRNPLLRRTMASLVTVEQAARVAGLDPARLVEHLNRAAAGLAAGPDTTTAANSLFPQNPEVRMPAFIAPPPPALRNVDAERIVDLDVRDDLRSGREPFSRIMTARRQLRPGDVLRLRAIFEPVPLYAVMAKQGLDHWTEQLDDGDWRVWFYAPGDPSPSSATEPDAPTVCAACAPHVEPEVSVLDVRGLEPPEPMLRTLAALEQLPPGGTLVQLNVRVPRFLLPRLEELGYEWEVREQSEELVRLLIRRRSG